MPAKRALAVLDTPPAEPTEQVNKALRISAKVRCAIDLMVAGNCKKITEAAAKVGLARESLGRAAREIEALAKSERGFYPHNLLVARCG